MFNKNGKTLYYVISGLNQKNIQFNGTARESGIICKTIETVFEFN